MDSLLPELIESVTLDNEKGFFSTVVREGHHTNQSSRRRNSRPSSTREKINVFVKEYFRAVLLKPVEGMRDRWTG
jgi:hypothetical protein